MSRRIAKPNLSRFFPTAVASINIKTTLHIKEIFALKAHFALSANSLCG